MRTDAAHRPPTGHGPGLARFRALVGDPARRLARLGRRLGPLGWARALAAATLLATLIGLAYRYGPGDPVGYEWLYDGRSLAATDAARIAAALQAAEVPCLESGGKVGVPAGRRAKAVEVLAKAKLGPRPLDDVLDEGAGAGPLWESPQDRVARERRQRERACARAISGLPGVIAATVKLWPIESGSRLSPTRRFRATVFVQSEPGLLVPAQSVQSVVHVLYSMEGVDRDEVTLLDPATGHEYLVAGRPDVERHSTAQAQADELQDRIRGELPIEGARVLVRIDPADPDAPPPVVAAPPAARPAAALKANRPLRAAVAPADPGAPAATPERVEGRATVLVLVPRSYYVRGLYREQHPGREPAAADLLPYVARSDEMVRKIIHNVSGAGAIASVSIERIDDLGPSRPTLATVDADALRGLPTWLAWPLGVAAAAAALALLGGGLLAARRPAPRSTRSARRPPFAAADSDAAEPAERVRALVRHDPAAAAGVLHRWIAQGGRAS